MRRPLVCLSLLALACSPPAAPQPDVPAKTEPAKTELAKPEPAKLEPATPEPTTLDVATPEPAKTELTPDGKPRRVYTPEELDKIGPRPAPEPPLTQAELDLLARDNASLTKEERVKQAYARRRKILQNPDSPMARQLEALRLAHSRGELKPPELPNMSTPPPESKQP